MERVLPDYRREIFSMRNDRRDLEETNGDLKSSVINMMALNVRKGVDERELVKVQ
eukprot:CAMPEP_0202966570 /NCGR_PEP_ID=MMETSP1396-20130829/11040_1 /ASSEMBLY_ACC=CAM_ASM_000872 /TAXON_ID= /ORGANISM="Pseudokeronopsis sp., Strain Brazil" /LENGTH=54 /DNA_ID=CAMNT_0049690585 /DNA_START=712 /DNA_END=876 /DNA_ORIENTATION=+